MFKPKLFTCMKDYTLDQFTKDLLAGIIVGIIALPLSIALGIASGVSPETGLITAVIGGFFVSLLGGSRVQIGGPTGAFIIIVLNIINEYGVIGLTISTFMAGIILILMGIFKFGKLIKFIPYPITTGFTNGIAVVIFTTQVKDFLGLKVSDIPSDFLEKWIFYMKNIDKISFSSLVIGVLTIGLILLIPKLNKKIPSSLVSLVIVTLICKYFTLDVSTIGSQFGDIGGKGIKLQFIPVDLSLIKSLMMPAITIAILGSIESLLSAVVSDGMIGGNHRSNTELIGQGVANIFSSLLGGIPVTGAIARTAANVKNNGRTPVSGIVHAFFLLISMILFMDYIKYIPMAALSGILIIVSYNMGDWEEFRHIKKYTKSDSIVFLVTFVLTVIFDLTVAIEVGIILAAFLFMKRMSELSSTNLIDLKEKLDTDELRKDFNISKEDIMFYEILGPFFFGAADKFVQAIKSINNMPKVLIIDLEKVSTIDSTGLYALESCYNQCRINKTRVIFVNVGDNLYKILERYDFIDLVGKRKFLREISLVYPLLKDLLK